MIYSPSYFDADLTDEYLNKISDDILDACDKASINTNTDLNSPFSKSTTRFDFIIETIRLIPDISIVKGKTKGATNFIFGLGKIRNIRILSTTKLFKMFKSKKIKDESKQLEIECFKLTDNEIKEAFFIYPDKNDEDQDIVKFIGINQFKEIICYWDNKNSVRVLHSIDNSTPPQKELPPAFPTPKSENSELTKKQDDV